MSRGRASEQSVCVYEAILRCRELSGVRAVQGKVLEPCGHRPTMVRPIGVLLLVSSTLASTAAFRVRPLVGSLDLKNRFQSTFRSLQPARGHRTAPTRIFASTVPLEPFEPGEAERGIIRKQVPHWEV